MGSKLIIKLERRIIWTLPLELPAISGSVLWEVERLHGISELQFISKETISFVDLILDCIFGDVIDICDEKTSCDHMKEINRKHSVRLNRKEPQTCCPQYFREGFKEKS